MWFFPELACPNSSLVTRFVLCCWLRMEGTTLTHFILCPAPLESKAVMPYEHRWPLEHMSTTGSFGSLDPRVQDPITLRKQRDMVLERKLTVAKPRQLYPSNFLEIWARHHQRICIPVLSFWSLCTILLSYRLAFSWKKQWLLPSLYDLSVVALIASDGRNVSGFFLFFFC